MALNQNGYWQTHTVVSGETLTSIAAKYGTTWKEIYRHNLDRVKDPNLIYPGWVLRVKWIATEPDEPHPVDNPDPDPGPRPDPEVLEPDMPTGLKWGLGLLALLIIGVAAFSD